MAFYLAMFAGRAGLKLVIHEVDILRHRKHDLAKSSTQQFWLQKLKEGFYSILLTSPPCSTFTRAVWSNYNGPRPIRSAVHPRGFKWLNMVKRKLADLGNVLADYSYEAMSTILDHPHTVAIRSLERPPSSKYVAIPSIQQASPGKGRSNCSFLPGGLWDAICKAHTYLVQTVL